MTQYTYLIILGQIYNDIVDQLTLYNNPLLSTTETSGVQILDNIYLIIDNELVYGSKIEIEYEITASAMNGLTGASVTDYFGRSGLTYDSNSKLLTEDRTNEEVGWKSTGDGEVTATFSAGGSLPSDFSKKIVLSKIISNNDETTFVNTALSGTSSYGVGQNSPTGLQRLVESEAVTIIPPTGTNSIIWIIITIFILLLIIILVRKFEKFKRN